MTDKRLSRDQRSDIDEDSEERDDAVIGVALRWSLILFAILAGVVGTLFYVVTRHAPTPELRKTVLAEVQQRDVPKAAAPRVVFTDVTAEAGITFQHENGARGSKLLPETMGGGCAFLDFDGDGHQDLLFVNSQRWPWDEPTADAAAQPTMALYRNDGTGNFTDVTPGSGLDISLYGMGVAVGDFDNDGRVDIYLSAVGENRLFHNEGGGKFRDVTVEAGVGGLPQDWSTSCGWLDYDNDGDLDLFVCNYVNWSREFDESQGFQLTGGGRAYGRPQNFEGAFPYLFRNDGGGKFTEVAEAAGLHMRNPATGVPMAKSLGATFADLDSDGRIDIIVANDTVQNFLFHNVGDGKFQEIGTLAGVAFDMNGNARGAMGIDAAPFRNNDAFGVTIGNFANEMTALYVSYGEQMQFMDEAISTGLGPNTRLELTFGVFFFDYDLDGRLDLFAANGHLEEEINRVQPSQHYEQPPQLFWNCGREQDTEFLPVTEDQCGADFLKPLVGRGASFADIDGDGDLDVIITASGQAPRLLRNDQNLQHNWLRFKLLGTKCNRDAIGAWIEVELADRVLRRQVMPTRSYVSQVELPVTIGLGNTDRVRSVIIRWPDGSQQEVPDIQINQTYEIEQSPERLARVSRVGAAPTVRPAKTAVVSNSAPQMDLPYFLQHRTCGDYLSWAERVESPANARDNLPRPEKAPCQGPSCSRSPLDGPPPPAEPVTSRHDHQDGLADRACDPDIRPWFGFISSLLDDHPRDGGGDIFHPPRLS